MNNLKIALVSLVIAVAVTLGLGYLIPHPIGANAPAVTYWPNYATISESFTQNAFTLGGSSQTTGSIAFAYTYPRGGSFGFSNGDFCNVQLSSATSTSGISADAEMTSVKTQTSTVSVSYFNTTSTVVTIATGTLTLVCSHFGS